MSSDQTIEAIGAARTPSSDVRQPAVQDEKAALLRILQLESDIRRVSGERELVYHIANESRSVLGFRQAFVLRNRRRWRLQAVSSVTSFDANAPLSRQVEKLVSTIECGPNAGKVQQVEFDSFSEFPTLRDHMFTHAVWMPLSNGHTRSFAGALLVREDRWPDASLPLVERIAATYAHAWERLAGRKLYQRSRLPRKVVVLVSLAALLLIGFLRAPLTVLAPVEVTGQDPRVVSTPLNGAIEDIFIEPNVPVAEGMVLARLEDTELRNALVIAEQEVIVARAQFEKLQSASFTDREAARELKIAEAELNLAQAARKLASERLSRVDIRAPMAGIAVFEDSTELIGRPVTVGERLMEIVDPEKVEFTIRLPVSDSIVLGASARVRAFLDSDPLHPIEAEVVRQSYRAASHQDGSFAYTLTARAKPDNRELVRIGAQGTAQLFGASHSLYFIIFRRPFSWLRQTLGF